MERAGRRFLAFLFCALAFWGSACASAAAESSANGVFERPPQTDMARAWLDLLFRGISLPNDLAYDAPRLGALAAALHKALGIYSAGVLVLADFSFFIS